MPPLALQAIGPLASRVLVLWMLHGVWIGAVALVIARAIAWLCLQRAPTRRYAVYTAALAIVVFAPPFAVGLQGRRERSPQSPPANPSTTIKVVRGDLLAGRPRGGLQSADSHRAPAGRLELPSGFAALLLGLEPWLLRAWLVATALLAARLAFAFVSLLVLRKRSTVAPIALVDRCASLSRRLGVQRVPEVRLHPRVAEPCLVGIARPIVLFPTRLAHCAPLEVLEAVLAHELAHLRRRDVPANLVQRVVEIVLCPNPAVHALSKELRRQRELCADALANAVTRNPLALATALAQLASDRSFRGVRRPVMALGAGSSSLLPRIEEMLGMKPKSKPSRWTLACLVAVATVAATSASSLGWPQEPAATQPQRVREVVVAEFEEVKPASKLNIGVEKSAGTGAQISYEIRFIDLDSRAWRMGMLERLTQVETEAELSAWSLSDADVERIFDIEERDPQANTLQAPKISAYESSAVSVSNAMKFHWVASVKPVVTKDTAAFQPKIKSTEVGVTLSLRGRKLPNGVELQATVHDKYLVSMQNFGVPASFTDAAGKPQTVIGQVQIPAWREYTDGITTTLAAGRSLLLTLDLYEKSAKANEATELGTDLVAALGGPKLEPERQVRERLVLITPRLIVSEEEEQPLK